MNAPVFGVSDFVASLNQTLEYAYGLVTIRGELSNFRVSKNKWVYFDLKDEFAALRFFGTVYILPGPVEDGMILEVQGVPRMHPQFGFSVNIQELKPVGEGSIKKAATLLEAKLMAEGLFDDERKRPLPYPPTRIGLITSSESAAYTDFLKVLAGRWGAVDIELIDVQVQGEQAMGQVVEAIQHFNLQSQPPEVLVITRGGGSAEDLQVFSTEPVTRAVAGSRIPTLVAIGHERDISLAELAADKRASTPSNAAEILVPSRVDHLSTLAITKNTLQMILAEKVVAMGGAIEGRQVMLEQSIVEILHNAQESLYAQTRLLTLLDPQAPMRRGYALLQKNNLSVRRTKEVQPNDILKVILADGSIKVVAQEIYE